MKSLTVTCTSQHALDYRLLRNFQGDLKDRTDGDVQHIKESMLEHGFSFPVYVWKHVEADRLVYDVIDGHGRLEAVQEFAKEGYEIPLLPVVFIEASDIKDAMERLLQVNTLSSPYTETGVQDLVLDISDINLSKFTIPNIDTKSLNESIGLLRNTLTQIDEGSSASVSDVLPQTDTSPPKALKTQEIVVQCKGCGKSFVHIVQ